MKRRTSNSRVLVPVLLMSLMTVSLSTPNANAAYTGPNSPGTLASISPGDNPWSDPDNAKASDNSYASTATLATTPGSSYRLKAMNYGFTIPDGATVKGIQVDVKRHKDSELYSRVYDVEILIVKSDGSLGTNNKADTVTNWPTSDATRSYGGATDLWGEVWGPADIDNSNFGVVVRVSLSWSGSWGGPTPTITAYVDYVSITVYYDPPPPAPVGGLMGPVNRLLIIAPYATLFALAAAAAVVILKPWKKPES
jgi:hypothetical protein